MASMLRISASPLLPLSHFPFSPASCFFFFLWIAKAFPVPAKVGGLYTTKSRKDKPIARLFCLVEARRCRMETARSVNALLYGGTWAALSSQGKPFQSASPPYLTK